MDTISQEDQNYILGVAQQAKEASLSLTSLGSELKNQVLNELAQELEGEVKEICCVNEQDLEQAKRNQLSDAMVDRLTINQQTIHGMIESLHDIIRLQDPIYQVIDGFRTSHDLHIHKVRIPIGVLAVVYESRPNVTIDVGALALKSSNAVILRGGKEAIHSNRMLAKLFQKALKKYNVPIHAIQLVTKTPRVLMSYLLKQNDYIDLVIPRGGKALINFVHEHSNIPVVKHDKGVCHMYIHSSADKNMAVRVLLNAKTQRPGVCNAVETAIFDRSFPYIKECLQALSDTNVILHGEEAVSKELPNHSIMQLTQEGYDMEYLSLNISIKLVDNVDEAIRHIQHHTSLHSEAIISQDYSTIQKFLAHLNSSALFVNASTRFHDGGQFGFGAEVGISTGKLHSRGPMGLVDLTTYKYIVQGVGQIRT